MKTLIGLALLLLALNASAVETRYPINLIGLGNEYTELDKNITDRIRQVLSNNPQYELLPEYSKDKWPRIDYLLMYTNMSNGMIVLSIDALWRDKRLKYPGYLVNSINFCDTQNQYQCILGATTTLQNAINNYNNPQMFNQSKSRK